MNPGADPLAALHPLRLPDPVGWWPPAPLWWLLAVVALGLLVLTARALWRYAQQGRYRRAALRELAIAARESRDADPRAFAARAANILRRAALARYPHAEVAPLCGADWLAFLDRSAGTEHFSRGAGRALVGAPYDPAAAFDAAALEQVCRQWLRRHR